MKKRINSTGLLITVGFIVCSIGPLYGQRDSSHVVAITNPALEKTRIENACEPVQGTAIIPAGEYIWILVHRLDFMNEWWPQAGGIPRDQKWSFKVCYGEKKDIGHDFELAAISVNEGEHLKLLKYLEDARSSGNWHSINFPPTTSPAVFRIVIKSDHK